MDGLVSNFFKLFERKNVFYNILITHKGYSFSVYLDFFKLLIMFD